MASGVLPQAVEGFADKHVSWSGIRILLQKSAELLLRAAKFLSPQAALRQHLMQFGIGRISLGCWFEILRARSNFRAP